jgi:NMT1-like family
MYYEPVWVFHRLSGGTDRLRQIKGRRIAIGPQGSGTRRLGAALLTANGIAEPHGELSELSGVAAARALQQGQIHVAILVAWPDSAAVKMLINDRRVRLMNFANAEAYNRQFPYLSTVVLPRGGIDLKRDLPPHDVHLLATTAELVVREDLHPAIVGLLAGAAVEIHGGPGFFHRPGQFPSTKGDDFAISSDAERYYKSGPPFLQRFLPFWAAVFVDRMIVLLVPIIALLIPLFRILPMLYNWRINSRIYRYYGQLRFLEDEVLSQPIAGKSTEYLARLDGIEAQINRLPIPLAFNNQVYTLREHIDLVRARIGKLAAAQ